MYQKLTNVNWISFVLILLGLRALADANLSQALIVACLSGVISYRDHLKSKAKDPVNDDIKRQLDEMKSNLDSVSMRSIKSAPSAQEPRRFF